jgi:hypothetical protein
LKFSILPLNNRSKRETSQRWCYIYGTFSFGNRHQRISICIGNLREFDFGGKGNPDVQGFATFGRVTEEKEDVGRSQQHPDKNKILTC